MKISETTDLQLRSDRISYITSQWEDLVERYKTNGEEIAKYLFLVNSGGAIAMLSFMGAMKMIDPVPGARNMLALFLAGVVLVGLGRTVGVYRTWFLLSRWRALVNSYYSDEIGWKEMQDRYRKDSKYFVLVDVIAWASFGCFIGGLAIAWLNFF